METNPKRTRVQGPGAKDCPSSQVVGGVFGTDAGQWRACESRHLHVSGMHHGAVDGLRLLVAESVLPKKMTIPALMSWCGSVGVGAILVGVQR